jgi:type VI secretion system protein ImpB
MPPKGQQQEIKDSNPARINLMVEVATGDGKKKTELPLRLLVMGDFTGRESQTPVAQREAININKDNFDGVMESLDIQAKFNVPDRLRGGDEEKEVSLRFAGMRDFHPERVARQIPEITRLVAARNLLQDLRNRVINMADFRKRLQQIVQDPAALDQLIADLDRVVPPDPSARIADAVEPPKP